MTHQSQCEQCLYNTYDEEYETNMCELSLDEDEYGQLMSNRSYHCPYFRFGDEYTIVRKQI